MLHIPWPKQHWDAIHDILVQRKATEKDLGLKQSGFSIVSAKTRKRKTVSCRKIQHRSITTLPIQLSNKQTDPANAFVENERHRLRNAVGNGECRTCFEKIQKFQLFFGRELAIKTRKNLSQHTSQLSAVPSISANILAFPSSLFRQGPKNTFCSLKNPKTENFIPKNSPKNNWASESLEHDGSRTLT